MSQPAAGPAGGDTFDELILRERQSMVRAAYLIAGSTAVAEEVTHDAFVTVFERWDRLDQPGAYLRRCVVNGAMRASRRRAHGERLAAVDPPPTEVRPAFDHTLDAVRRLAPRARSLVVLRYYAQLTTQKIADVLQIGPIDFGAPQDEVLAAVTAELGEPRGRFPGGGPGCEPVAEDVSWVGLVLTFEGPDPDSMRLTAWAASLSDNPQQPRNYRMEDGPTLGDPLPVWQVAYGSSFQIEPGGPEGFRIVTINLDGVTLRGSARPEEPLAVNSLWRKTTDCTLGD